MRPAAFVFWIFPLPRGQSAPLPPVGEQERVGQALGSCTAFDRRVQHTLGLRVEIMEGISIQ